MSENDVIAGLKGQGHSRLTAIGAQLDTASLDIRQPELVGYRLAADGHMIGFIATDRPVRKDDPTVVAFPGS